MEEFLFWLSLLLRILKYLLPFIIGGFVAILAFKLLGKPPAPYFLPIALFITLVIAFELIDLFKGLFK